MYIIIYLIVLAVVLFINHIIASMFYDIAERKGHHEKKYYWLSFWLGAVGYIMVAALPDLFARPQKEVAPVENSNAKSTEAKKEEIKEQSNLLDIFKTDN